MADDSLLCSLVDGDFVPSVGASGPSRRPTASDADVSRALAAAHRVHETGTWRRLGAEGRRDLLEKVRDCLDEAVVESMSKADAAETGVPLKMTRMINGSLREAFSLEALGGLCEAAKPRILRTPQGPLNQFRRPQGPVLILAPWNVPSGSVVGKLIAALLAGCPVILKPSEVAPTGLDHFLRAVSSIGMPTGVLQWLHGGPEVGAKLVADDRIRVVQFTGSADVGRAVAQNCAARFVPLMLECGGSNVAIVLEDADLDVAASGVVAGLTLLNGQWCAGISRVLAHNSIADDLVNKVIAGIAKLKIGTAEDMSTDIGPMSHADHRQRLEALCEQLQAQGGKLRRALPSEAAPLPQGHFMLPSLVTDLPADVAQVEQIFGPIATVQPFQDPSEAVRLANQRPMLQSYIFGKDIQTAAGLGAELDCGSVMLNAVGFGFEAVTTEAGEPCEPTMTYFGEAGLGVEAGGHAAVQFFAGAQVVGVSG
eukprot:TRINITY_DN48616_c0_g1_i1.p1 TRINITY_DN48616_c0_g1~~TRINITY_DN48616_c0_g1_i1.p1  ORF type:complete len:498 (-),score=89.93 TRINITY_DN48616_c0_g1_i1:101-1546(-)